MVSGGAVGEQFVGTGPIDATMGGTVAPAVGLGTEAGDDADGEGAMAVELGLETVDEHPLITNAISTAAAQIRSMFTFRLSDPWGPRSQ
jgi:hypothetical protein